MSPAEEIALALGGKRSGSGWSAKCPAHDDKNPSLSIWESPPGVALVKCHAGCNYLKVWAALNERSLYLGRKTPFGKNERRSGDNPDSQTSFQIFPVPNDAPPPPSFFGKLGSPSAKWPLKNLKGELLGYEVRFEKGDGKEIRPLTCWKEGQKYVWRLLGFPIPRPMFGLDQLAARPESPILLVEGCKTAEAARKIFQDFVVMAWIGGAKNVDKTELGPLKSREVKMWPDHDDPGKSAGRELAQLALKAGANSAAIVQLPNELPPKWDLADPLPDGWEVEKLHKLLDSALPIPPSKNDIGKAEEWPEPQPLPDGLPEVPPFNPELLPESFRPWIEDIAERIQCPPDFPAVGAMVALAAVVGRQVGIRPKAQDEWTVTPNLWGYVIGRPGMMKTAALKEPLRPLFKMEAEAAEEHQAAINQWNAERQVVAQQKKLEANFIQKAIKDGKKTHEIAASLVGSEKELPTRERWMTSDSTVEKLGELLNQNPKGLLIFRDELTGFLRTLDREGHEGSRAFYLEAWNGDGPFTFDRIGRGTVEIEAACVSILGGIQPGPLVDYLAGVFRGGSGDDGLLQRFQMVWPDTGKAWKDVDRWPDREARERAYSVFERLKKFDGEGIGAEVEDVEIPFLRFTPDAHELFLEWRSELETRLRDEKEHPAFIAHLAKYRSLVPSLALLIHLADVGHGPVGIKSLARACDWAEFLEAHARRVYAPALSPEMEAARNLDKRIANGDVSEKFTAREVYRNGWRGLNPEATETAISVLQDFDRIRQETEKTGGRPRKDYVVNPRIREGAP